MSLPRKQQATMTQKSSAGADDQQLQNDPHNSDQAAGAQEEAEASLLFEPEVTNSENGPQNSRDQFEVNYKLDLF